MQRKGFDKTHYEISDIHIIFSMSYFDDVNKAKDYGTGKKYTMLEAHTITLIDKNPGITVTEISKTFGRTKSAISQLISRLERKGLLIKAQRVGMNRSYKGLFVTAEGRDLSIAHIEYDAAKIDTMLDEWLKEFTVEELNKFYRYLEIAIQNRIISKSVGNSNKNDDEQKNP